MSPMVVHQGEGTGLTFPRPMLPDFSRFPEAGRDLRYTFGEIGSAGHWIKKILHHMFLWKAKARAGWWLIPE